MARGRSVAYALSGITLIGVLASCTATARVIDVYTALDGQGDRRRQVFFTDTKELHCVTEAAFGRKGATLEVLFRQLQAYDRSNQKYFDTDRVYARAEFAPSNGDGRQFFSTRLVNIDALGEVSEDAPLDPGRYQCEVYLDGKLEDQAVFNIMFPDCPAAEIIASKPCYGFFEDGRECPRYGLTSGDAAKCTCRIPGWECK
jgi:hypothetical protein